MRSQSYKNMIGTRWKEDKMNNSLLLGSVPVQEHPGSPLGPAPDHPHLPARQGGIFHQGWLNILAVLWIRIRSDPELFAGSGVGSGINHFGSGSGQSGSVMNFIPNFSVKKSHFLNQIAQKNGNI